MIRTAGVCLATGFVLLASVSPAAAKRVIYGVRVIKPPPSSSAVPPAIAPPGERSRVVFGRRLLAARHRSAYRAHPVSIVPVPATARGHSAAANLFVGPGFPGLADNGSYPSDVQIAAGPGQLVEMTNTTVAVYNRSGRRQAAFAMSDILGSGHHDDLGDPQIAWDQTSGRWLASAMDLTSSTTEISVSDGVDPRGGWQDYSFSFGSKLCPDQPRLGFSSTVVVVATELFHADCRTDGSWPVSGAVLIAVDKQAMLAGAGDAPASQYGPDPSYNNYGAPDVSVGNSPW